MKDYITIPTPDGPITRKLVDVVAEHEKNACPMMQRKHEMAKKIFEESGLPEAVLTPEEVIAQRERLKNRNK